MQGQRRRTAGALAPATAALLALLGPALAADAARPEPPSASERPDPATVQRYGPGYRYPRAGWVVVHVEGTPYDRGYQHGRLLSAEIADYLHTLAAKRSNKDPGAAWREVRTQVNALFLRRYDPEYLEEMKGIADGASAAGAKFEGRALDLLDVASVNSDIELEFLDAALAATPTGLEAKTFREPPDEHPAPPHPEHCSAFAATGPATADGKIVFGHITMFNIAFVRHFNVWLDVKPEKGHRVLMQTYPGGIQSGMDYYLNDAGLLVAETTIAQTKFDINGQALASRIRKALQYSSTIDEAVATLKASNNGMYTNEWLLGDTKTNEVAMFELGTDKSKLWRSGNDEWFGGTKGFYWGCNNAKDLAVRLETVPCVEGRPANLVWRPSDRDRTWLRLFDKHQGKITAAFGFEAFTTPPLAAFSSLDAKFTTSDLAKDLKTWALFGPPMGRTWDPTDADRRRLPDVQPLVPNDWTLLSADAPPVLKAPRAVATGASDSKPSRLETLRSVRDEKRAELDRLRELVASPQPGRLTADVYRKLIEELTRVELAQIAARVKMERLVPKADGDPTIATRLDRALDGDPELARLAAALKKAKGRYDTISRITRTGNDPASVDIRKNYAESKKAYDSAREEVRTRLVKELSADSNETEVELAQLDAQAKHLRDKLEALQTTDQDEQANTLKREFARRDLERAESNFDAAEAALNGAKPGGDDKARNDEAALIRAEIGVREDSQRKNRARPEPPSAAVDLGPAAVEGPTEGDDVPHPTAWHGTILPKTDADTWLAAGFADYERIVSHELAVKAKAKAKGRGLTDAERDEIAVARFAPLSRYTTAVARLGKDVPLNATTSDVTRDEWYEIAANKGVLLLSALRTKLGDDEFLKLMDAFGRKNAGQEVATGDFVGDAGAGLKTLFDAWLRRPGLPDGRGAASWSVDSFEAEPEQAVIVYGTLKEADAQREAADRLQRQIRRRWSNVTAPILADNDANRDNLKGKHVLLVGRPDSNSVAGRLASRLPVAFGPASFVLRGKTYANAKTSLIVAGPNPDDPARSVVLFAGLSAEATWRCVEPVASRDAPPAEALLSVAGRRPTRLVVNPTRADEKLKADSE